MGTLVIISFATIIVLLRKRHLSVLPAGECRHKMTWRIPVPLSFLACRGIVRRFLVRLCKSNNIFLYCQIIRRKNDHKSPVTVSAFTMSVSILGILFLRVIRCHNRDVQRMCSLFEGVTGCHKGDTAWCLGRVNSLAASRSVDDS